MSDFRVPGEIMLVAVVLVGVGVMLMPRHHGRERSGWTQCAGNLKMIGLGLIIYAGDDAEFGYFPGGRDLGVLHDMDYVANGKIYACPDDATPSTFASTTRYRYIGAGLTDSSPNQHDMVLAYCDQHDDWINVLYVDGHVKGQKGDGRSFLRDYYITRRRPVDD